MLECPRCESERIFGGRCLDCGETLGAVQGLQARAGAITSAQVPGATPRYSAHHVLPFEVPDALRRVHPREEVAALVQRTTFSMVRAVRRDDPQEPQPETEPPAAPSESDGPFDWPDFDELSRERLVGGTEGEAMPTPPPPRLGAAHPLNAPSAFEPPGSLLDELTGEGDGADDPVLLPIPEKLGDVPPEEIAARYDHTLVTSAPQRAPVQRLRLEAAILLVVVILLGALVAFLLYDLERADGAIEAFAEGASGPVQDAVKATPINARAVLNAVAERCAASEATCLDANAWVRRSDAAAFEAEHGAAPPATEPESVVYEVGYTARIEAKGWVLGHAERAVGHRAVLAAPAARVQFGESAGLP